MHAIGYVDHLWWQFGNQRWQQSNQTRCEDHDGKKQIGELIARHGGIGRAR